jgi:uncharacterized membrane protein YfcA
MWILLLVSIAGFLAQLIDGSMGMAFGVSATSLLLFLAYSPPAASAVVHIAEVATTAVSGASHIKFGNVDWKALLKIAIPGSIGAFVGAILLSNLDFSVARPWTASILLTLGVVILLRFALNKTRTTPRSARKRWLIPLGLAGGFIDSTGGGGWGPVVTTSLTVSSVLEPRKAIGTTNTAEFAVALSSSLGFLVGLGAAQIPWDAVIALMVGGVVAAPFAAWLVTKVSQRALGLAVGFLIVLLNVRILGLAFDMHPTLLWGILSVLLFIAVATFAVIYARINTKVSSR